MNAAYRHWDRINWYPRYYICLDTVVGLSHKDEIARLIRESDQNGIRYFILRQNLVDCLPSLKDHPRILVFDKLQEGLSLLSCTPITTGSHAALMCAVFGYTRIYLLGIDCNYVERIPEAEKVEGIVLEMADTPEENSNYFFSDYQQKGDRYHILNPNPDLHLRSWRVASKKLVEAGVVVLNVNRKSKVAAFPFCDFENVEQEWVQLLPTALGPFSDFHSTPNLNVRTALQFEKKKKSKPRESYAIWHCHSHFRPSSIYTLHSAEPRDTNCRLPAGGDGRRRTPTAGRFASINASRKSRDRIKYKRSESS